MNTQAMLARPNRSGNSAVSGDKACSNWTTSIEDRMVWDTIPVTAASTPKTDCRRLPIDVLGHSEIVPVRYL